jgi:DNA (cytosine-5)-methyltransferase 1
MLLIGTDCSGIDAPIEALTQMGISFKQLWYCDTNKFSLQTTEANHPKPELIFKDITLRDNSKLPYVDLYVCGFPCQSFSMMGKRQGTQDPRGTIFWYVLDTIKYVRPKYFLLENVRGLMTIDRGETFKNIISSLNDLGDYTIRYAILNTKNYGIPQNRERVYILGMKTDIEDITFPPPTLPVIPFEEIIDTYDISIHPNHSKYHTIFKHKIKENIYNILDINFLNKRRTQVMYNICPTLMTIKLYYIYEIKRFINTKEMGRLQGFNEKFKQVVSNTQFTRQMGNTMSVNVLKAIFKELRLN